MSDWKQRLTHALEPILRETDPRPKISAYHNMPYAIFLYSPTTSSRFGGKLPCCARAWNKQGSG